MKSNILKSKLVVELPESFVFITGYVSIQLVFFFLKLSHFRAPESKSIASS